jgi:hypothetical protein
VAYPPAAFSLAFLGRYACLYYAKQVQNDQDHSDNDQNVNPGPEVRQGWNYDRAKKAQQPQDDQNHDNYPQHDVSPFEGTLPAARLVTRWPITLLFGKT